MFTDLHWATVAIITHYFYCMDYTSLTLHLATYHKGVTSNICFILNHNVSPHFFFIDRMMMYLQINPKLGRLGRQKNVCEAG